MTDTQYKPSDHILDEFLAKHGVTLTLPEFGALLGSMRMAMEAEAVGDGALVKVAAVHEAYVNAQRAVSALSWRPDQGAKDYRFGLETMQDDAVRAIRTAAEEARNG